MSPSVKILSVVSGVVKRFLPRFCALVIQSDPHLATAVGVTVFNEEDDAAFSRWAQSNWALKSRDFSPPAAGVMLQGGSREEKGQVGRSVRTEAPDVLGTPLLALRGPIWGCPLKLRTTDRQKETGTEVLQPQNWNLLTASTELEDGILPRASKKKCLGFGRWGPQQRRSRATGPDYTMGIVLSHFGGDFFLILETSFSLTFWVKPRPAVRTRSQALRFLCLAVTFTIFPSRP